MNETVLNWFKTLFATFIQGAVTSITVIIVDPIAFNFADQWKKTLMVAVISGIIGACLYLKKSPLPGVDGSTLGVFLLSTALILGSLGAACKETKSYKTAVQACYDLSVGINATVQVTMQLNKQGTITNDTYLVILEAERTLALANEEFRKLLLQAGEINTTNKFAFIGVIDSISQSLADLQTKGVLYIKSTQAAATFSATLATIRTSLIVLRGFIDSIKSPVPLPANLKAQMMPKLSREYFTLLEEK